jgi:hypothetical protein
MWRLAFVVCVLPSCAVFAGESKGQLQVGFTITGSSKASMVAPASAAIAPRNIQVSVPLPPERPAAFGRANTAQSAR